MSVFQCFSSVKISSILMSTFGIGLEKRRERTRRLLSEETFSNFGTRLKACPRKSLLREYGLVTGFVKQCAVVKSIHREFIVQFVLHKRSYEYSRYFILFVKKIQDSHRKDRYVT